MEKLLNTSPDKLNFEDIMQIVFNGYIKHNYCIKWEVYQVPLSVWYPFMHRDTISLNEFFDTFIFPS